MEPSNPPRPERRFTPDEMRRMMQSGQLSSTKPPATKPQTAKPTHHRSYLRKRDARDLSQVTDVGDQIIAMYSPKAPISEASVVLAEDGVHTIEVTAANGSDADRLARMIGKDYEGIEVTVYAYDDPDPEPITPAPPRWSLEVFIKAVSLKASIGDRPPEAKPAKSGPRLAPTNPQTPKRRPLKHGRWMKRGRTA